MLVGDHRVARLGAGVNAVENFRLLVEVEAEALKMFIPVRKFDHHLHLRIHRARRFDDQIFRRLVHQFETELRPAFFTLGRDVGFVLRRVKKEIVLNDFVKMPRRQFRRVFDERAVFWIRVAKRFELATDAAVRQRQAAGNAHAVVEKEFFDLLEQLIVRQPPVALHLDVNLVHLQLAADARPVVRELLRILKTLHDADGNINRHVKVRVIASATDGRPKNQAVKKRLKKRPSMIESKFHNYFTSVRICHVTLPTNGSVLSLNAAYSFSGNSFGLAGVTMARSLSKAWRTEYCERCRTIFPVCVAGSKSASWSAR